MTSPKIDDLCWPDEFVTISGHVISGQ